MTVTRQLERHQRRTRLKVRVSRDKLEASVCRQSFQDFVRRFWDEIVPEPLVWNWHMAAICDAMQEAAELVFRRLPKEQDYVFNVPPGTSKSTICSIMFPAWVWTRMPSARTICASYAHDLALELSRKSRALVKSEKYRRLFPLIQLSEDQDAKGYFANTAGGSRYAVGTGGSVTGFHGHFLIVDDPLDPRDASRISAADLKEANRWIGETLSSRKVDKLVTVTMLIMQRLHQNDPAAVMLDRQKRGIKVRHFKLPAEITGSGLDQVRPRKYARCYRDSLLDPHRLSRKALEEARIVLGQFGFAGQMLQHPVPPEGGMFKVDRLHMEEVPPKDVDFVRRVRCWDKAGTSGGGAYTAGVLEGLDRRGRFWVLDVVRGQWDSAAREAIIKQTATVDGRGIEIHVEQEPGSGGKESAENTVKNLAGFRVRCDRPTGDKVLRADPFSVQVNAGNVYVLARPWASEYRGELQFFPFSRYKDQVDASSGAFAALTRPRVRVGGFGKGKRR